MSDATERLEPENEPTLLEIAEMAARRIPAAIVIAGAIIAVAIYAQPGPPRFQVAATSNGLLRIDTRKGTIISCEAGHCFIVLRHGQHLEHAPKALPRPAAQPALPAPQK